MDRPGMQRAIFSWLEPGGARERAGIDLSSADDTDFIVFADGVINSIAITPLRLDSAERLDDLIAGIAAAMADPRVTPGTVGETFRRITQRGLCGSLARDLGERLEPLIDSDPCAACGHEWLEHDDGRECRDCECPGFQIYEVA